MRYEPKVGRSSDRGVTLVTFALALTAICAVIALIIGASLGYSAERNSQTSSDAAALAAASKLRSYQLGKTSLASIDSTAVSVAEANEANVGEVICEIVKPAFASSPTAANIIGLCTDASAVNDSEAAGVLVRTAETRNVPFGGVNGMDDITGSTLAAATVQPLITGASPFMVCSSDDVGGHPIKVLEDVPGPDNRYDINPAAVYDPAADAPWFVMWGNDMKVGNRQCGEAGPDESASESWRGLVEAGKTFPTPGYWGVKTGNSTGTIGRRLQASNECDLSRNPQIRDLTSLCELIVPLCITDNGLNGATKQLYCVAFGRFEIGYYGPGSALGSAGGSAPCQLPTDSANSVVCGRLLGPGTATTGSGAEDVAGLNDVVVIKLVE